ncbi:hypothetical protein LBMAG33_4750 [Candidatus Levyibacteriota bacterium]|nr:hypothetical protein LBMAG33_4750 [Candidatus Levybacteria bacterium]
MKCYVKINLYMNLSSFFFKPQKKVQKTIEEYKQELLIKQGKDQFNTLIRKGLSIPVALL